jgi:hypothetical protein
MDPEIAYRGSAGELSTALMAFEVLCAIDPRVRYSLECKKITLGIRVCQ